MPMWTVNTNIAKVTLDRQHTCVHSIRMARTEHIHTRVDPDTKAKARAMTEIEGTTLSKEIEKLLLKWARKYERREK